MAATTSSQEHLAACCGLSVRIWAPNQSAHPVLRLAESVPVRALSWSHNNRVLAVAGDTPAVSLFAEGRDTPMEHGIVLNGVERITCVHLGSKKLMAGCSDGSLQFVDLRDGFTVHALREHQGGLRALAVSPHESIAASTSSGGQLLLHEVASTKQVACLATAGTPTKRALAFSNQGGVAAALAAGDDAGGVSIWDVAQATCTSQMAGRHKGVVTGVAFAADSASVVYSCGRDQALLVMDARRGREAVSKVGAPLATLALKWDGRLLALGTTGGEVLVYDVRQLGQPLQRQAFGEQAAISALAWQRKPRTSSKSKSGSAGAATASAADGRGAAQASGARPSSGVSDGAPPPAPKSAAAPGSAAAGFGSGAGAIPAVRRRRGSSSSLTPEASQTSLESGADADALRAMSPVLAGASSDGTPDGGGAAAPANSTSSLSTAMAPLMVTPGFGAPRTLATRPGGPAGAGESTPTSRATDLRTASAAAGQGPAPVVGAPRSGMPPTAPRTLRGERAGAATGATTAVAAPPPPVPGAHPRTVLSSGAPRAPGASSAQAPAAAASTAAPPPHAAAASGPPTRAPALQDAQVSAQRSSSGADAPPGPSSAARATADALALPPTAPSLAATSAHVGPIGAAIAHSTAAPVGPFLSSAPGTSAALPGMVAQGGPGVLHEAVFKAYVDEQMQAVRQDIRNLHLDVLTQFHQAQMDLMSLVQGVVERQDELAARVEALASSKAGSQHDLTTWLRMP